MSRLLNLHIRSVLLSFVISFGNLTWMKPIEQKDYHKHKDGVEDVQEHFMTQQVTRITLQILNNPEEAPDYDQSTRNVEIVEMALPWYVVEDRVWGGERRGG
jgi:hypothetical protein